MISRAAIDASADFGAMMSSVRTSLDDGIITAEEKELISEAAWRALRTVPRTENLSKITPISSHW